MSANCQLLLFTRYPEAGKTKTRLIAELGANGAAQLQRRLSERVALQANLLAERTGVTTVIHYTGGSRKKMTSWLGPIDCVEQKDGDLGQRMQAAFKHAIEAGSEKVVLIGSDIPDITSDLLQQAFTSLVTTEVVIGPTQDGGYYLIGMTANQAPQLYPLLFEEMPWSTRELFTITKHRLEEAEYDVAVLPMLRDIDLPTDLPLAKERGLL